MKARALIAIGLALAIALPGVARPAASPVNAQTSYAVAITSIDSSNFPDISTTVAVSDPTGLRVPGLGTTAFTLLENTVPTSLSQLSEDEIGLQLAVVIESSNVFSKRDINLITRLDDVKTSLINFAVGDGEGSQPLMRDVLDNVSVFAPEGILLQNSSVGGEVRNALIAYQSEFRFETGLFALITQAMDAVSATPTRPGMRKEVIVYTSGIDASADAEVSALAARANAEGITIHMVLVGPPAAASLPLAENVKALADLTSGSYRYFDDPNSMISLWNTLVSQRVQYRLTYRSKLRQSGQHTLQALANVGGTSLLSAAKDFVITVQPPTISLVEVPREIIRSTEERGADPTLIEPRTQDLKVQIDFPDGHPRSIVKLQLIADLTVADERLNNPFDTLNWDLTNYSASGTHGLQVYVLDELGLDARSDVLNVVVTVNIPPPITTQFAPAISTVVGVAVVGIAVIALLVAGLVIVRRPTVVNNIVREAGARVKEATEPFIPTPHRGAAKGRLGKAFLQRIDETTPGPHPTIELVGDNLRLGRDETLAQIAISDKSVSRLHARITEEGDGLFFIHDEGSTSGTWVNYKQVSMSGQQLQPGDIINLGRVQLRFSLRQKDGSPTPAPQPPPVVVPMPQASPVVEHSTESFDSSAIIKSEHEPTDQGLQPTVPARKATSDQYHTEAFSPPFEESKERKQ
jgi:pSer/pThr/pTyr-binding forkhead associated (FHA) protein